LQQKSSGGTGHIIVKRLLLQREVETQFLGWPKSDAKLSTSVKRYN